MKLSDCHNVADFRRLAKRRDRHADTYDDDELTAYNRMLSELSRDR